VGVIVPTVALPPAVPSTSHVTSASAEFETVAANATDIPPTSAEAVAGDTDTLADGSAAGAADAAAGANADAGLAPDPPHPATSTASTSTANADIARWETTRAAMPRRDPEIICYLR
jgi:hypothetical protein